MKRFLIIALTSLSLTLTLAEIRYVSKTGSSTPPYTSWETASDSIQKCIDYSAAGDTIVVANGIYYESLIVNKYLSLIGSSLDSCIIDGTGLVNFTVEFQADGNIQLFTIIGKGEGITGTRCIFSNSFNISLNFCKILNAGGGISLIFTSSFIDKCIISNVNDGYQTHCDNSCNPIIKNSVIKARRYGILIGAGTGTAINNLVMGEYNALRGIGVLAGASSNIIINNIVIGFNRNIDGYADMGDSTAIVHNNISAYALQRGFTINKKTDMRNNISAYNGIGTDGPTGTNSDYNLYWQNNLNTTGGLAEHDIVADPMFVNDTIPVFGGSFDYHLQAFSPAIDAGDPTIFDVDETRSDIGAYGGPGGIKYNYRDLAPRPPVNLSGQYDSASIIIRWNKNTESDFSSYRLFRDTVAEFTADSTNFLFNTSDTSYTHLIPYGAERFYYKLTAIDLQGNESCISEELPIIITSTEEYPVIVNDYGLYQNYPNPFNPATIIGFYIKQRGYVKLMVYDIKGEIIDVLINEEKEAGYYETEFSAIQHNLSSGIYLYRIEVIGKEMVPVYTEMKKMILLK